MAVRMKRRDFLQRSAEALAASLAVSAWVESLHRNARAATQQDRVLVLLELRGGNDGLNTVIPYRDPAYRQARPTIAIADGPALDRHLILHPALAPLQPIWEARRLAVALGVGWPQPSRSHFKATDQWATGTTGGSGPGWLAAGLDRRRARGPLVSLGPTGSSALEGGAAVALQMAPALLKGRLSPRLDPAQAGDNTLLRRMLKLEADGRRELIRLRQALRPLPRGLVLPQGGLGQQVGLALQLIGSGAAPPVIQMAQGGYDTHAGQEQRHRRQLAELAGVLASFERGLEMLPGRPRVTLLTTSEFGRRLRENESRGTDHGSASMALLMGDGVPHPFLGDYPELNKLDERGDLLPGLTPRQLYEEFLSR
ncbi:MAG: DUF1501 domain-containing protein [Cyanobium sp. CZS 25K]|nr:DUF1501 domain-containing protein [Cyanobium sp. CZS25K]